MDAITGGSAQASVLCRATVAGSFHIPLRAGMHCHPETIFSAVVHPRRGAHRVCVADDYRMVDA